MNDIYLNKVNFFFEQLDSKCIPILAAQGMRGHALYRILASHQEVWWDSSIMNEDKKSNYSSLEYPVHDLSWKCPRTTRSNTVNYITAHTAMFITKELSDKSLQHIKNYYTTNSNLICYVYMHAELIKYMNRPYIYIYTSNLKKHFTQRSYWFKQDMRKHFEEYDKYHQKLMTIPSTNPLAFNIDIHKLFSKDEQIFELSYKRIVNHFNFTSNINDVRSFILTYLEREQSVSIGDY